MPSVLLKTLLDITSLRRQPLPWNLHKTKQLTPQKHYWLFSTRFRFIHKTSTSFIFHIYGSQCEEPRRRCVTYAMDNPAMTCVCPLRCGSASERMHLSQRLNISTSGKGHHSASQKSSGNGLLMASRRYPIGPRHFRWPSIAAAWKAQIFLAVRGSTKCHLTRQRSNSAC